MASNPAGKLPKRFEPYLDQALTEASLRYGSQEAALGTILGQLNRNRSRDLDSQASANSALLGQLKGADANVDRYYQESGLDPAKLGQLAQDPSGRRLAGEMAGYRAQNQSALLGQLAGDQFQRSRINQNYGDQFQQFGDQFNAMQRERGTFTSSLLDQLIGDDRKSRSAANAAARQQQHDDAQAALGLNAAQTNALIGQGLYPDEKGNLTPLPGGKADPNAPQNQPKPKKPVRATPTEQSNTATDYGRALTLAQTLTEGEKLTPALRQKIEGWLLNGAPATEARPVYDTRRELKKGVPNPNYGKPLLNKDGTAVTTDDAEDAIPQIDNEPAVRAALDMVFGGSISPATLEMLHGLGYAVRGLKGAVTPGDVRKKRRSTPNQNKNPHGTGEANERAPYGVRGRV